MDHEDEEAARVTDWQKFLKFLNKYLREARARRTVYTDEKLASQQGSPGMDPAVWRNLPKDLLQRVFARLPLHQTVRLQCLSKAWHWNVTAKESAFRRIICQCSFTEDVCIGGWSFGFK